jgi:hypothetical protein
MQPAACSLLASWRPLLICSAVSMWTVDSSMHRLTDQIINQMIANFGIGRSDRPYYLGTIKIRDLFVRTSRTPSRTGLDAVNQITDQSDQMRTVNQINMMDWIE